MERQGLSPQELAKLAAAGHNAVQFYRAAERHVYGRELSPSEDLYYGYFLGGDPREWLPDVADCHPHELAAWAEVCQRWALNEPTVYAPSFPDSACQADQSLGVGTGIVMMTDGS